MSSSKNSSNFFVFVSSVFMVLVFITTRIEAREHQQVVCTRSCGNIQNISYPFRVKGDPAGCGDKDYELSCLNNNQTILQLNSGYYYVKNISYDERTITVVDDSLASGTCAFPRNTVTLKSLENLYSYYSYSGIDDVYFVRCSSEISNSTYIPIPCLNQNQSYAYFLYGGGGGSLLDLSDLPKSCWFVSAVPIDASSQEYKTLQKSLMLGLGLSWSVKCRDCRLAGGWCEMGIQDDECYKEKQLTSIAMMVVASILLRVVYMLHFLLCYIFRPWIFAMFLTVLMPTFPNSSFLKLRWFYEIFPRLNFLHLLFEKLSLYYFPMIWNLEGIFHFSIYLAVIVTKVICTVALVGFLIHKYRTTRKAVDIVEKFLYNQHSLMPRRYLYAEIIAITGHLSHKLGQGGFGSVYKGQLFDGTLVAVKVLQNSKFSGEEFINEVSTIGRIHHSNIVRLLGFCSDGSKRALIYEYMPNGSLDRHIFSKKDGDRSFTWEKLHQIALETARGIEYLHNGCDVCILHFDIKPHNILLDANFNPKVADFGLAKFHPKENDFICVNATRGTIGYIAPELISRDFGMISCKSDVYGFGMLLLEMAGGRKNSFAMATRSSKEYFPTWAYDRIIEGRELEFQNASEIEEVIARKLCIIGLWCIQVNPTTRPSITKVLEMLEGNIQDLQIPPKPFFSSSSQVNSIEEIQVNSSTELFTYCDSIEDK